MQNINAQRFATRYVVDPTTGCWNWTGGLTKNGYGRFAVERTMQLAHRVSYTIHRGPISGHLLVCHHCDNKRCVNPDHFFLGTHKDNLQDASRKGRLTCPSPNRGKWRIGKTKYDVVVNGVGRIRNHCAECGAEVFTYPKSESRSGFRFCDRSCTTSFFNRRRAKAS